MGNGQRRGFGVAGALDRKVIETLATEAEATGYAMFWLNDTPDGDGLAGLTRVATLTDSIRLGVGVIPVDRVAPAEIARRVASLGLPAARLTLGIGSGSAPGGLGRVRAAVVELRELLDPMVTLAVGALGPKMTALGGEVADAVLLNWLTPDGARVAAGWVAEGAGRAGRPVPHVAAYVRVALGPAGGTRLRAESDRYAGYPSYAAHFARLGTAAFETAIAASDAIEVAAGLARYDGLADEVVIRAIAGGDNAVDYQTVLRAAAPVGAGE